MDITPPEIPLAPRPADGQRQTLQLSCDHDDVWGLQLGNGDPVPP
ncbi:hypothetical protein ACWELO_23400 [Streptomyces sp. NPDC004596]